MGQAEQRPDPMMKSYLDFQDFKLRMELLTRATSHSGDICWATLIKVLASKTVHQQQLHCRNLF